MSFVTFILMTGFYLGNNVDNTENKTGFDPGMLGYIYTKSMFIWIFETTLQKAVFYFFNIGNPPFFELLAYTGYKFVVLCLIVVSQLTLGNLASYFVMIFTGAMFSFFFFMTLKRFSSANTLAEHIKDVSMNRKTFMLANSAMQFLLIWILSLN